MKLNELFNNDYFQAKPNKGMIVKFKDDSELYILIDYKKDVDHDGHWDGDGSFVFRSVNDPDKYYQGLSGWDSRQFEKVLTQEEAKNIKIVEKPKPVTAPSPEKRKLSPEEIKTRRDQRDTWESDQYDIEREKRPW